jgi:hypothetical protein
MNRTAHVAGTAITTAFPAVVERKEVDFAPAGEEGLGEVVFAPLEWTPK